MADWLTLESCASCCWLRFRSFLRFLISFLISSISEGMVLRMDYVIFIPIGIIISLIYIRLEYHSTRLGEQNHEKTSKEKKKEQEKDRKTLR